MASPSNTLGQSVARVDGRLKVTGQARYAADQAVISLRLLRARTTATLYKALGGGTVA